MATQIIFRVSHGGDNAWDAGMLPVGAPIECWGRIQSRKYHKKTKEAYEVSISELI